MTPMTPMTPINYKELALDLMIVGTNNLADEVESQQGDVGYAIFMMEDCDDEYNDVREIGIGTSTYSLDDQQELMKKYMKSYKITKKQIQDYRLKKGKNENLFY